MNCLLEDRKCSNCSECDVCDLDDKKRCDNCCGCIENQSGDMRTIIVRKEELEADKSQKKRNVIHWKPKKE